MTSKLKNQFVDLFKNFFDERFRPAPSFRKDRKVHFEVDEEHCIIRALCKTKAVEVQTHSNPKYVNCKKCLKFLNS